MKRRHFIGLFGAGSLAAGLVRGSGAFSDIVGERQTAVAVVGDEDAYLALDFPESKDVGSTGDIELRIQNQAATDLNDLTVDFDPSNLLGEITAIAVNLSSFTANETAEKVTLDSGETFGLGTEAVITVTFDNFTNSGFRDLFVDVTAKDNSGEVFIETEGLGRVIEIQGVPNTVPAGCPVTPSVTVDVADDAQGTIDNGGNDVTVNNDVDGDVIGGNVEISGVTISGEVDASGNIGTLKNATIGGPVSSGSGGDIGGTADDVRIDGDLVSGNDIDIINSVVAGKLKAGGNISTLKSTDVGGSVVTGDGGDIGGTVSDVKIGGSIRCGNDLDITDSTVCGILNVGGNVATFKKTSVGGSVIAGGGETFSDVDGIDPADDLADSDIGGTARDVAIFGDLLAGNDIDITDAEIEDRIAAAGNVTIKDGDAVEVGDVVTTDSGSTLKIEGEATLNGDIDTEGEVVINGTVNGDVSTEDDVTVSGTVDGDVSADGDVEGSGKITGTDPRSSNEEN